MDGAALSRLDAALPTNLAASLRDVKPADAAKAIASLYAELDYVHPFRDCNSRTLRAFTHQLAKDAGWHLDWASLGQSEQDRNLLYWARDRAVNKLALPHVGSEATMKRLIRSLHAIPVSPTLHELIEKVLRPSRAVAFPTRPETIALQAHPELETAYQTVRAAATFFNARFPGQRAKIEAGVDAVRSHVQSQLNAGEITQLSRGREVDQSTIGKSVASFTPRDRDTER